MQTRVSRLRKIVRLILFWYVSNILWNLYQLGHNNLSNLVNYDAVLASLYLPGPLSNSTTSIWAYIFFIFLFVALWIWATNRLSSLLTSLSKQQHIWQEDNILLASLIVPMLWGMGGWFIYWLFGGSFPSGYLVVSGVIWFICALFEFIIGFDPIDPFDQIMYFFLSLIIIFGAISLGFVIGIGLSLLLYFILLIFHTA